MRPIPVVFNLGPLQVHTYGIGLAITFWFAYRYFGKRLRDNGYPVAWLTSSFVWIVVAAIVGARVVHVVANASFYVHSPGQVLQVWHGGLSSFGGLLFAVPTGLYLCHRRCPELPLSKAADLVTPVLMAAWALGRLLGPQVMVRGGGRPTTAWYGMYYADQVGKRVPAPIFQSIECLIILLVLFQVEKRFKAGPAGMVVAAAAALWGLDRFFDEAVWLAVPRVWTAVEVTGLALAASGFAAMGVLWRRHQHHAGPPPGEPSYRPASPAGAPSTN